MCPIKNPDQLREDLVLDKSRATQLLRSGAVANTVQTWSNIDEVPESARQGKFGIRAYNPGNSRFVFNLTWDELQALWPSYGSLEFYISESVPVENILVQFEVWRSNTCGIECHYSFEQDSHRAVFRKATKVKRGVLALLFMRHYLDDIAWEQLQDIFNRFDQDPNYNLVVELSVLDYFVGMDNSNTVFWEIRHY